MPWASLSKTVRKALLGGEFNNMIQLNYRKATLDDLKTIIVLLAEDELGQTREQTGDEPDQPYIDAFYKITIDQNQYLMVVELDKEIVGTCHLTIMPSLTFHGATRMQIEAVRVAKKYRSQKIGAWMMEKAIEYAKAHHASIIQLTTNKTRGRAKEFYECLGFEATHEGMKLYLNDLWG